MFEVNVFIGKLGHEKFHGKINTDMLPNVGDLITLPRADENSIYANDVYVVKQVLKDYTTNEFNVFVKFYNWED